MAHQPPVTACPAYEADLVLFHYGDLAGAEHNVLQNHVTACAGCAAYLAELATLLPLTVKSDVPPAEFWMDYNRELRQKIDGAVEKSSWWPGLSAFFRPRLITAMGATAVIALALTFTLGRNYWPAKDSAHDDAEVAEALPVAENLDFYTTMDVLDDLDVLELMGNQSGNPA
ncbi:MAG TPA: hypothetical protein VNT76_22990 [Candidatus Binatus sp.]|nr:hypothetical protein [Candidatus Binatus sp.]